MHRPQIPQPGFGSVTLLQKFTPHFKILDLRLKLYGFRIFVCRIRLSIKKRVALHFKIPTNCQIPKISSFGDNNSGSFKDKG